MKQLSLKKPTKQSFKPSWHKLNWLLTIAIIGINLYTILRPFYPVINYKLHKPVAAAPVGSFLAKQQVPSTSPTPATPPPAPAPDKVTGNRIIAPSIGLEQHIYEGTAWYTISKGVWLRPNGSTPDKGGNTVLAGHRFTYSGPSVFYHLDQLHVGDKFLIYWQNIEYDYQVTETKVVPPTAVDIEDPTSDARVTMYTCTPLWNPKDRLVIIAKLIHSGS